MSEEGFKARHSLDPVTGIVSRTYMHNGNKCKATPLTSRLCDQLAGYTLIEKDLRSALLWLDEIERRHTEAPTDQNHRYGNSENRENYTIIKGLFVALLAFYGKCFSRCEGRPVKLERSQLDPKNHETHDELISYRHNFAAHSGAERVEKVGIVLVHPEALTADIPLMIFRELQQPDLLSSERTDASIRDAIENARAIANSKIDKLSEKILKEEVIPNVQSLIFGASVQLTSPFQQPENPT